MDESRLTSLALRENLQNPSCEEKKKVKLRAWNFVYYQERIFICYFHFYKKRVSISCQNDFQPTVAELTAGGNYTIYFGKYVIITAPCFSTNTKIFAVRRCCWYLQLSWWHGSFSKWKINKCQPEVIRGRSGSLTRDYIEIFNLVILMSRFYLLYGKNRVCQKLLSSPAAALLPSCFQTEAAQSVSAPALSSRCFAALQLLVFLVIQRQLSIWLLPNATHWSFDCYYKVHLAELVMCLLKPAASWRKEGHGFVCVCVCVFTWVFGSGPAHSQKESFNCTCVQLVGLLGP